MSQITVVYLFNGLPWLKGLIKTKFSWIYTRKRGENKLVEKNDLDVNFSNLTSNYSFLFSEGGG